VALVVLFSAGCGERDLPGSAVSADDGARIGRSWTLGLSFRSADSRGQKRLSAERIGDRPLRLGIFTLNPVRELVVENAHIRIDRELRSVVHAGTRAGGAREESADVLGIGDLMRFGVEAGLADGAVWRRVVIEGVALEVRNEGLPSLQLESTRAYAIDERFVRLRDGIRVSTSRGQRLEADAADWALSESRLRVPGAYRYSDARGSLTGANASFEVGLGGTIERLDEP